MNDSNGCTYFIQAKSGGDIKIGYTSKSDPIQRLRGIQTGNPKKLQIVGILRGNREAQLHAKFDDIRLEGEWFKPEQALVDFIEKHCSKELSSLLSHGITKPEHKSLIAHPRVTNVTTLNLSLSDGSKLHFDYIFDFMEGDPWDYVEEKFCGLDLDLWDDVPYGRWDAKTEEIIEYDMSEDDYIAFEDEVDRRAREPECEMDVMKNIVNYIIGVNETIWFKYPADFFEKICINVDRGWIFFMCQAIDSNRRMDYIEGLADHCCDMDDLIGGWLFVAVGEEESKVIDLLTLGRNRMFSQKSKFTFDLKNIQKTRESSFLMDV